LIGDRLVVTLPLGAMALSWALLVAIGKKPVVLAKFLPGFIANRLQSALTNEALFLLDNGYATPEEIDTAVRAVAALAREAAA